MRKLIYYTLFLINGITTSLPVSAQAVKNDVRTFHENQDWEFANFGEKANGKISFVNDKMQISTQNTRHCFYESDAYSFAWQKISFPYDDCSKSTVTVRIEKVTTGSAGIMIRTDEKLGAANAHLEVNSTGDAFLFCRNSGGVGTTYKRLIHLGFPAELRLVRQGNVFNAYYKNSEGEWEKGASVIAEVGEEQLAGFYACSGSESQIGYSLETNRIMEATFSGWSMEYEENYIPAMENYTDMIPVAEGTLLRDNFNDGSLSNSPESIINPVWGGIRYGNLPEDPNGGRYWHKEGDGLFFLGDKKWADYQVSIDLSFNPQTKSPNEFMVQLRYQDISIYSKLLRYYAVGIRDANKLFFEKYASGGLVFSKVIDVPKCSDFNWHKLKVRLIDRKYQVYFDNELLIEGMDEERPVTYGNVSLKFTDVSVNLDNLEILNIEDPVNGSNDNYLMDYFDIPIPEYLKKYGF